MLPVRCHELFLLINRKRTIKAKVENCVTVSTLACVDTDHIVCTYVKLTYNVDF